MADEGVHRVMLCVHCDGVGVAQLSSLVPPALVVLCDQPGPDRHPEGVSW